MKMSSTSAVKPKCYKRSTLSYSIWSLVVFLTTSLSHLAYADIGDCYEKQQDTEYDGSYYFGLPEDAPLKKVDGYYVLYNSSNEIVQERLYDIKLLGEGGVVAKRDGLYGVIGKEGNLVFDFEYDDIDALNNNFYIVSKIHNGKQNDALVKVSNTFNKEWVYPTSNELDTDLKITSLYYDIDSEKSYYKVTSNIKNKGQLSGLIDGTGAILVPIVYDEMEHVESCENNNVAMEVRQGNRSGIIDRNHNFIVPLRQKQFIDTFPENPRIMRARQSHLNSVRSISDTVWHDESYNETVITPTGQVLFESETSLIDVAGDLYRYSKNGKFGLTNGEFKDLLPAEFDEIVYDYDRPIIAIKDGKTGIVEVSEDNQKLVIKRYYDSLQTLNKQFLRIESESYNIDNKYQLPKDSYVYSQPVDVDNDNDYILLDQEVVSDSDLADDITLDVVPYLDTSDEGLENRIYLNFYNTYFIVSKDRKYGLINSYGTPIVAIEYDEIIEQDDFLLVKKGDKYGIFDIKGQAIQPVIYDAIIPTNAPRFTDELNEYVLIKNGKKALLGTKGKLITELLEVDIDRQDIRDGHPLIPVSKQGMYGFADRATGKVITPFKYEDFNYIGGYGKENDNIIVQREGRTMLLGATGKPLLPQYNGYSILEKNYYSNSTAFIISYKGLKGAVDAEGKVIIEPVYEELYVAQNIAQYNDLLNEGAEQEDTIRYIFAKNDLYGLLDNHGNQLIEARYLDMQPLSDSPYFAAVNADSMELKYAVINEHGEKLTDYSYDEIGSELDGLDVEIHTVNKDENKIEIWNDELNLIKTITYDEYFYDNTER